MSHYTTNLNLYEKDPSTDGADTFNITTMMNENWDKLDTATGKLSNLTTTAKTNFVAAINEVNAKDALPSQSGHSNAALTTNGTTASWSDLEEITSIVGYPDYANGVSKGSGSSVEFTATANGWVYGQKNGAYNWVMYVYVNNSSVGYGEHYSSNNGGGAGSWFFPVKSGDVVKFQGGADYPSISSVIFYPSL